MLAAVAAAAIVLWAARTVYHVVHAAYQAPWDAYATMYGAGTVRSYLKHNGDRWPKSWDDIRPIFEERYKLGENALTFDELKERLEIDFNVDPEELRQYDFVSDGAPFNVIRLRNGKSTHWEGAEPNTLILEYLKKSPPDP